jgi:hypothetical protein
LEIWLVVLTVEVVVETGGVVVDEVKATGGVVVDESKTTEGVVVDGAKVTETGWSSDTELVNVVGTTGRYIREGISRRAALECRRP